MSLDRIHNFLKSNAPRKQVYIPNLWKGNNETGMSLVNYSDFLADKIEEIKLNGKIKPSSAEQDWTKQAVIYNIFIRFFTAFDHNQDGKLGDGYHDITLNNDGIRETGTFLKTIALLPYLKSLGINTIHLLPITTIGVEGRKGDLGSPYAIKNSYKIEPSLADPIVNATVEEQYKALVEAAVLMDMRVVQEFIFRTASMDSDLISQNPDWFYWIKKTADYGPPKFKDADLKLIKQIPKGKGKFIPPPENYRNIFVIPPEAKTADLKIASAFADWPPDDLQPPWTDVTYLRLYNYDFKSKNNYNYIAYNTIRYYDPELAKAKNINKPLWRYIEQIIPYFQKNFGIHGAMVDMGHALPKELKKKIIKKARRIDPSFAFWDENFENTQGTKSEGYNAVIGGAWYNITKRNGFKKQILSLEKKHPLPFFGTSETHNSPRYGVDKKNKKMASWILFNLLPQAIPFIHNGFELNENLPVNTGLNFNRNELDILADKKLPLFHKSSLDWNTKTHTITFIRKIQTLKVKYPWIFNGQNLKNISTDNPKVLGFYKQENQRRFIVLFNTNFFGKESFFLSSMKNKNWRELLEDKPLNLTSTIVLSPGKLLIMINE